MGKHVFLAFSNPVPGKEEAFLEWQKNVHIPDGLGVPSYAAATFYKLSDTQILPGQPADVGAYLTVWEVETDDLPATKAAVERMLGEFTWSDAIDDALTRTATYSATSERRPASGR